MEQFNLDTWLKDKSHKLVTRDGRPVRILNFNLKGDKPICIAVDDKTQESITTVDKNGHCLKDGNSWHESNFDLFFADEEEELTEFEGGLFSLVSEFWQKYALLKEEVDIAELVKENSKELLDLARKEFLKDFLIWKKCDDNLPYSHIGGLNERYLIKNSYCIKISDLENLPKEK